MSEPIGAEQAAIWNARFEKRLDEMKMSQRKFSALYRERFGTGSQSDVCKWMHVGEKPSNRNTPRKFPEFETMRNIAEILGVSVGYLIGETDCETFEMEQVSKYTGLSPTAIKSICGLTSGKRIPPFYKYPDFRITTALELILSNPTIVDYLKNICSLAESISEKKNPRKMFEIAVRTIPEQQRDVAVSLWADPEAAVDAGIEPTEELCAFARALDDAALEDLNHSDQVDIYERNIRSEKYALQETHDIMINTLLSEDNLKNLLSHTTITEDKSKQHLSTEE